MLRELTANQWSDARITEEIQSSDHATFIELSRIRGSGFGQIQEDITLAADATTFSLTAGTPPTALTYNLEALIFVEHQGPGGFWSLCNEIPEGQEFALRSVNVSPATGDVPPLYRLRRPNIVFLPAAGASRALRVTYRPAPTALSSGSTNMNCPDTLVQFVFVRACIMLENDVGEADSTLAASYETLRDEMFRMYDHATAEGRSMTPKLVESPGLFF